VQADGIGNGVVLTKIRIKGENERAFQQQKERRRSHKGREGGHGDTVRGSPAFKGAAPATSEGKRCVAKKGQNENCVYRGKNQNVLKKKNSEKGTLWRGGEGSSGRRENRGNGHKSIKAKDGTRKRGVMFVINQKRRGAGSIFQTGCREPRARNALRWGEYRYSMHLKRACGGRKAGKKGATEGENSPPE